MLLRMSTLRAVACGEHRSSAGGLDLEVRNETYTSKSARRPTTAARCTSCSLDEKLLHKLCRVTFRV